MDEIQIVKQAHEWKFMQGESCFYTGSLYQAKNEQVLELKNGYDITIITITSMKNSGFHLFRSNKGVSTKVQQEAHSGSITIEGNAYVWDVGIWYRFYVQKHMNGFQLIMCDQGSVLGYVKDNCVYVKALMYSSVLCAFWLWLHQRQLQNENIVYDEAQAQKLSEIQL